MSASAFSDQIANLEKIVGGKLFTRTNRGTRITARGQDLLKSARELMTAARKFDQRLNSRVDSLRLATMISVPEITFILRELHQNFPDAQITTVRLPYLEAMPSLENKQVDGLFVALPALDPPPHTHFVQLQEQKFLAAVPLNHELARKEFTTLEELSEYEILAVTDLEQDVWTAGIFGPELLPRIKRRPLVIEELQTQDLVAAGFGINICPESIQFTTPRKEIRYIPIENSPPLSVGLLTLAQDRRPIIKELREYARCAATKNG